MARYCVFVENKPVGEFGYEADAAWCAEAFHYGTAPDKKITVELLNPNTGEFEIQFEIEPYEPILVDEDLKDDFDPEIWFEPVNIYDGVNIDD